MSSKAPLVACFLAWSHLAAAPAEKTETVYGLIIPMPSGWVRKDDPSSAVYLVPPQDQNPFNYVLCIVPPTPLQGTHWETHRGLVQALIAQAQWTGGEPATASRPDGPGMFIKTSASGRTAAGEGRQMTLFTALHGKMVEAVIGINQIDRDVVEPMVRETRFKIPGPQVTRPKIVEAYRRANQRLYNTRDGGALAAGSLMYDRLWLRSDGTADFSTVYLEGYAASTLAFKTDPGLLNGDFGAWKQVGDKIHLTRIAGQSPTVCVKEKDSLRVGGELWEPMPRVDGLTLSGRWEIKSPPEEKVSPYHEWIELTPEGRFKTEGVLRHVASLDIDRPKPPEKCAGTYTVRDWTMFFKFDDGTAWSTDFSTLGREQGPDSSLLFRTYVFPRAKP